MSRMRELHVEEQNSALFLESAQLSTGRNGIKRAISRSSAFLAVPNRSNGLAVYPLKDSLPIPEPSGAGSQGTLRKLSVGEAVTAETGWEVLEVGWSLLNDQQVLVAAGKSSIKVFSVDDAMGLKMDLLKEIQVAELSKHVADTPAQDAAHQPSIRSIACHPTEDDVVGVALTEGVVICQRFSNDLQIAKAIRIHMKTSSQAGQLAWTKQKGHSVLAVTVADGVSMISMDATQSPDHMKLDHDPRCIVCGPNGSILVSFDASVRTLRQLAPKEMKLSADNELDGFGGGGLLSTIGGGIGGSFGGSLIQEISPSPSPGIVDLSCKIGAGQPEGSSLLIGNMQAALPQTTTPGTGAARVAIYHETTNRDGNLMAEVDVEGVVVIDTLELLAELEDSMFFLAGNSASSTHHVYSLTQTPSGQWVSKQVAEISLQSPLRIKGVCRQSQGTIETMPNMLQAEIVLLIGKKADDTPFSFGKSTWTTRLCCFPVCSASAELEKEKERLRNAAQKSGPGEVGQDGFKLELQGVVSELQQRLDQKLDKILHILQDHSARLTRVENMLLSPPK